MRDRGPTFSGKKKSMGRNTHIHTCIYMHAHMCTHTGMQKSQANTCLGMPHTFMLVHTQALTHAHRCAELAHMHTVTLGAWKPSVTTSID